MRQILFFIFLGTFFFSCVENDYNEFDQKEKEFKEVIGKSMNIKYDSSTIDFCKILHNIEYKTPYISLIRIKCDSAKYFDVLNRLNLINKSESINDTIFRSHYHYRSTGYKNVFWTFKPSEIMKTAFAEEKNKDKWWPINIQKDTANIYGAFYILDSMSLTVGSIVEKVRKPATYSDGRIVSIYKNGYGYFMIDTEIWW